MRRARTVAAWTLLVGSLIGWPISALTLARHEPQFVLLTASHVRQDQGDGDGP